MIELELPGEPLTWRSPFVGSKGAWSVRSPIQRQLKGILKQSYKGDPVSIPLCVDILFILPIPKATSRKKRSLMLSGEIVPVVKKDRSNLLKFAEDVMNKIVYLDDCQIVDGRTSKVYGENPRTIVRIYSLPEYVGKFGRL